MAPGRPDRGIYSNSNRKTQSTAVNDVTGRYIVNNDKSSFSDSVFFFEISKLVNKKTSSLWKFDIIKENNIIKSLLDIDISSEIAQQEYKNHLLFD